MSDTFATIAERDEHFDALVDGERVLFERKMDALRCTYAEIVRELDHRRNLAAIGNPAHDDLDETEDIEGDQMQDDEEAGVL